MIEINCGERLIQSGYRLAIRDVCKRNGIEEGDVVDVFIVLNQRAGVSIH